MWNNTILSLILIRNAVHQRPNLFASIRASTEPQKHLNKCSNILVAMLSSHQQTLLVVIYIKQIACIYSCISNSWSNTLTPTHPPWTHLPLYPFWCNQTIHIQIYWYTWFLFICTYTYTYTFQRYLVIYVIYLNEERISMKCDQYQHNNNNLTHSFITLCQECKIWGFGKQFWPEIIW